MAAMRAASSVPMVFGAAVATLVAVGAILVGPSIAECSGQPGFSACLRDGLVERGLLAPRGPELHADIPPPPREDPRAPHGFLDAQAAEISPMPPVRAALGELDGSLAVSAVGPTAQSATAAVTATTAGVFATGIALTEPVQAAAVDATLQTGVLAADAGRMPDTTPSGVALVPIGALVVAGTLAPAANERVDVAMVSPGDTKVDADAPLAPVAAVRGGAILAGDSGEMTAVSGPLLRPLTSGATLAAPSGTLTGGGDVQPPPMPPTVSLRPEAPVEPLEAAAAPPASPPSVPVTLTPAIRAPEPPDTQPAPPVFNPDYPNVLVLPPPLVGENSAFVLLQLD